MEVVKLVHHKSISKKQKLVHYPRVGLVYDDRMCQHFDPECEIHPEKPDRIKAVWAHLESHGITKRCMAMKAKEAEDRKITLVHKQKYVDLIKKLNSKSDSRKRKIASKFDAIYLNKGSSQSAYLAAGAVIQVSEKIAKGELDSAVAVVRPPGHHAEADKAMGYCIFNNVAIAASVLVNDKPELGISKILIVDWDVHHGNGTQKMFWQDPRVLVFNVHRHDSGKFYPFTNDGSHSMIGEGSGTGYNVNVPWDQGECGDADYFAVWDHVLIPITKAFNPDMILISGGFDAAAGDTMGGCSVTPNGYSVLMKKLMPFARGRIMMALEGGYNLESLSNSVLACVEALLENKPIIGSSKAEASPLESTWRVIEAVCRELSRYWPMLNDEMSNIIKNKRTFLSEEMGKHGRLGSKDGTNNAKLKHNKITSHSIDVSASNRGISLCPGDQSAGILNSPRLVGSVPDFQPFFERGAIRGNEPYVLVRGFWILPSHSELYASIADDHGHMPNYAVFPEINCLVVITHSLLDTAVSMSEDNIIPSAEKLREWKQLIDVSKLMGFNIDWMEDLWEEINAKANARVAQLHQIIANSREKIKQCEVHLETSVAAHQRAVKEAADTYEKMQQLKNTMAAQELLIKNTRATRELLIRNLGEELHSVP